MAQKPKPPLEIGGQAVNLLKVSDLVMHLTRPNGTCFKSNYGTEAAALEKPHAFMYVWLAWLSGASPDC
jgi:hypothetical protein